jgi:hypothetical protein
LVIRGLGETLESFGEKKDEEVGGEVKGVRGPLDVISAPEEYGELSGVFGADIDRDARVGRTGEPP